MANSWQTSTGEMLSVWELCWGKNVITNIFHETAQPKKSCLIFVQARASDQRSREHIIKTSTNSQSCINLRYDCTCLFSCMLSSRMHHAARHAYCSALLHSLWLRVAFPPSWQHLFGRRAAAWVSLSDGANESHVTPGRGAGELRRVKVNQGKIMLKRWNVPASGFSNNFLQLPSGKKKLQRKPAGTTCAVLSLPKVVLLSLHGGKRQSC